MVSLHLYVHVGYNYSADIWAFGLLLFELFEGTSPIGTVETEETQLFRTITGFTTDKLKFTENTPADAKYVFFCILHSL